MRAPIKRPYGPMHVMHAGRIAAAGALLAAIEFLLASRIGIDSDIAKLSPAEYGSVKALERLRATVGGESEAAVVIESDADSARGITGFAAVDGESQSNSRRSFERHTQTAAD